MPRPIVRLEISEPEGPTKAVTVDRTPFVIGSDRSADLTLALPGVAPRHAQIVLWAGIHHLLADPDGPGLTMDGRPVPEGGCPLAHGAQIGLGAGCRCTIRFLVERTPPREEGDRLVTLMEIARTITSSLAVDEVLDRVLEGAVRFSGAERGYLFLRDGEHLVPWARGAADSANVEVSRSVAEEVARTGKPIYRDFGGGEAARPATDSVVRLRLQAILCLPLAVRQDVIGVVYLDSKRHLPHHQPDLPWLEALAGLAAIAIQNSRLVEDRVRAERTIVIGQMARAIVHDVRSPLSAIRGLADLLHERAPEGDPARPHLKTIIAEVDRLAGLTGDLLQFSKEAPPLQRVQARLADLVRRTMKPFEARLARGGVQLVLDLDEEACASLDAQRFLRVLHNLVSNSLDAMRTGGTLEIRCQRQDGRCLLAVRDTGCGMSEQVLCRVFEPFFSHGKAHGTGLGMVIVRKIVEEHGGSISVESSSGQGTTVLLGLPAVA